MKNSGTYYTMLYTLLMYLDKEEQTKLCRSIHKMFELLVVVKKPVLGYIILFYHGFEIMVWA